VIGGGAPTFIPFPIRRFSICPFALLPFCQGLLISSSLSNHHYCFVKGEVPEARQNKITSVLSSTSSPDPGGE